MPSLPGDTETSRTIIVRLSIDTHRALRIRVAKEDTSIQKWVENLIERELGIVEQVSGHDPECEVVSGQVPGRKR
jgi:predicted HicB family RNase H-like nuclease